MASGNDLIRYITRQAVEYIQNPQAKRTRTKEQKEHWTVRWFGLIPLMVSINTNRFNRTRKPRH